VLDRKKESDQFSFSSFTAKILDYVSNTMGHVKEKKERKDNSMTVHIFMMTCNNQTTVYAHIYNYRKENNTLRNHSTKEESLFCFLTAGKY